MRSVRGLILEPALYLLVQRAHHCQAEQHRYYIEHHKGHSLYAPPFPRLFERIREELYPQRRSS
jgi:hypothetical protein